MKPGFQGPIAGYTSDGLNWTLTAPVDFVCRDGTRLRIVPGATTDGPSIPAKLQGVVSPVGPIWPCGVLHDAAYRAYLQRVTDEDVVPWAPTKAESDALIREAMEIAGIDSAHAYLVFEAVHLFGHTAFDEDRRAAIAEGRIVGL